MGGIIPGYETAEFTMQDAAAQVRAQIRTNLANNPALEAEYDRRVEEQAEIDRLKEAGEPIPASLIRNPFYLRLYREQGMLIEDGEGGPREIEASLAEEPDPSLREPATEGDASPADPVDQMLQDNAEAATRPAVSAAALSPSTLPATQPR